MDIAYKTFHPTDSNPLSKIIDSYLSRQVYLDGINYVVKEIEEDRMHLSSLLPICYIDDRNINHWQTFEIHPDNRQQKIYELKSYFYMNSIAQTEENFETYLKKTVELIKEKIARPIKSKNLLNRFISLFKKSKLQQREDNRTRLKFIKEFLEVDTLYENESDFEEAYKLFLLVENIRHITVHAKMILKESNKKINKNEKQFQRYFAIRSINGENVVTVEYHPTYALLQKINELAYLIFRELSKELSFPITEKPKPMPPQYVMDAAHAFMREQKEKRETQNP